MLLVVPQKEHRVRKCKQTSIRGYRDPTGVTGQITFAPTTKILQFGVNSGAWEFDREIV